jgi:hypothetical protein
MHSSRWTELRRRLYGIKTLYGLDSAAQHIFRRAALVNPLISLRVSLKSENMFASGLFIFNYLIINSLLGTFG